MKVTFELSKSDLRFFRDRLKQVRGKGDPQNESVIIDGATDLAKEARLSKPPEFVLERIVTLEKLIAMLNDAEWRLEGTDRKRILDALAYFVDPDDLIPDRIPGVGYLDDAIMVELVARELAHEIAAYDDFCVFREGRPHKEDPARLESRRTALQARMRRRRRRERQSHRTRRSTVSRIRLL